MVDLLQDQLHTFTPRWGANGGGDVDHKHLALAGPGPSQEQLQLQVRKDRQAGGAVAALPFVGVEEEVPQNHEAARGWGLTGREG